VATAIDRRQSQKSSQKATKETKKQVQLCRFFAVFVSFCKRFSREVREREARSPARERTRSPELDHNARATSLRFQLAPEFEAWLEQEQI
jgi:hypothetical protein